MDNNEYTGQALLAASTVDLYTHEYVSDVEDAHHYLVDASDNHGYPVSGDHLKKAGNK